MRQIITPLPKVAERQKSTSPSQSARSSPKAGLSTFEVKTESPAPRRHTVATTSMLRKRSSPPHTDPRNRQYSHPSSTSSSAFAMSSPPEQDSLSVDPSTLTSFPPSISHSLSSSPMSLNSYAFAMMDVIDP